MDNAITYIRVSTKEQLEGTSLQSQELACRECADSRNLKILRMFSDKGESAKFADRTALLELIDFVRKAKGQVQYLIVWKVDRFARNVEDYYSIKGLLLRHGVRIISVTEPITESPEGRLMETMLAGFAQFDNDIRAARTVQGMRRRIQEGIFPWTPPLGYRNPSQRGEKKTVADVPAQPLFELGQKAWKEAATGAHTKAEMRRLMIAWGIVTKKGRHLSPQAVDNFFRNRYYAGALVDPWSGEEFMGRHVPMVSEAAFQRVQQVFGAKRGPATHQTLRAEFPLRGLVRCGKCERYLTAAFSKGRSGRYPYYRCGYRGCDFHRSFPVAAVHSEFEGLLRSLAPAPDLVEKLGALILRVAEDQSSLQTKMSAQRAEALQRVKREGEELVRMRAQGLITDEEFIAHKDALRKQGSALEGVERDETLDPRELRRCLAEIKEPLNDLRGAWESLKEEKHKRRRFERLVLPAGFVNQRIGTADLGLLFNTFRQFATNDSTVVPLVGQSLNRIAAEILEFARLFKSSEDDEPAIRPRRRRRQAGRPPVAEIEPSVSASLHSSRADEDEKGVEAAA
jgi:site-specific DNA recombinase